MSSVSNSMTHMTGCSMTGCSMNVGNLNVEERGSESLAQEAKEVSTDTEVAAEAVTEEVMAVSKEAVVEGIEEVVADGVAAKVVREVDLTLSAGDECCPLRLLSTTSCKCNPKVSGSTFYGTTLFGNNIDCSVTATRECPSQRQATGSFPLSRTATSCVSSAEISHCQFKGTSVFGNIVVAKDTMQSQSSESAALDKDYEGKRLQFEEPIADVKVSEMVTANGGIESKPKESSVSFAPVIHIHTLSGTLNVGGLTVGNTFHAPALIGNNGAITSVASDSGGSKKSSTAKLKLVLATVTQLTNLLDDIFADEDLDDLSTRQLVLHKLSALCRHPCFDRTLRATKVSTVSAPTTAVASDSGSQKPMRVSTTTRKKHQIDELKSRLKQLETDTMQHLSLLFGDTATVRELVTEVQSDSLPMDGFAAEIIPLLTAANFGSELSERQIDSSAKAKPKSALKYPLPTSSASPKRATRECTAVSKRRQMPVASGRMDASLRTAQPSVCEKRENGDELPKVRSRKRSQRVAVETDTLSKESALANAMHAKKRQKKPKSQKPTTRISSPVASDRTYASGEVLEAIGNGGSQGGDKCNADCLEQLEPVATDSPPKEDSP